MTIVESISFPEAEPEAGILHLWLEEDRKVERRTCE